MAREFPLLPLLLLLVQFFAADAAVHARRMGVPNCTAHTFPQNVDHFGYDPAAGTYEQRYFVYDGFVDKNKASPSVVFFYCGNEDNVELYVNNTGLMWELGAEMNAMLVFAEHRYYGESDPSASLPPTQRNPPQCLRYLTTEQATADYATLIRNLRLGWGDTDNAIKFIGWGGSYGGMLGAWMRMRYPDALDGMVAASAPILSFQGLEPPYDPNTYDRIVSRDAGGPGSGAAPACADNLRAAWPRIEALSKTPGGREALASAFSTCAPLSSEAEALGLIAWAQANIAYMAMGNYPYSSDYMTHGDGKPMVAWPMRAACAYLKDPKLADGHPSHDAALLRGVAQFAAVYYNRTGVNAQCLYNNEDETPDGKRTFEFPRKRRPMTRRERDGRSKSHACAGNWGYQYCTQMVQPFASNGITDMFYPPSAWNVTAVAEGCLRTQGVTTRPDWANVGFPGSRIDGNARFSNIVFTNGYLDPWSGGGVTRNISTERDLLAFVLPNGAHHLDLMWTHPDDPPDALEARRFVAKAVRRWAKNI